MTENRRVEADDEEEEVDEEEEKKERPRRPRWSKRRLPEAFVEKELDDVLHPKGAGVGYLGPVAAAASESYFDAPAGLFECFLLVHMAA
jgi:hypothetical protein